MNKNIKEVKLNDLIKFNEHYHTVFNNEIDYKPILKKLGLNDEEVNQFLKKENIAEDLDRYIHREEKQDEHNT